MVGSIEPSGRHSIGNGRTDVHRIIFYKQEIEVSRYNTCINTCNWGAQIRIQIAYFRVRGSPFRTAGRGESVRAYLGGARRRRRVEVSGPCLLAPSSPPGK